MLVDLYPALPSRYQNADALIFVAGLYATAIPCTALSSLPILRNRGNPEFEILLVASPLVSMLRLPLYGIPA